MNSVISRLLHGEWLFDELIPPFLRKLEASDRLASLKGAPRPLPAYVLTLTHYRLMSGPGVLTRIKGGCFKGRLPCIPTSRDVWTTLSRSIREDGQAAILDPAEQATLTSSWADLRSVDPFDGGQFDRAIEALVPLENSGFGAASTPHLFGCIFVTKGWIAQSRVKRLTSLVHEMAHQELFLLNLIDRLVNASSDHRLVHAPFQGTARPPIGRLHAAHALFRMRRFQDRVGWHSGESTRLLRETCATFAPDELTPLAADLVNNVYAS